MEEEEEEREATREKFARERDEEREGDHQERYDEFGRIKRDTFEEGREKRNYSPEPPRHSSRERDRGPSRRSGPRDSPERRRESPPFKRRRRDDEYDDRFDRYYNDRGRRRDRNSWPHDYDRRDRRRRGEDLYEGSMKTFKQWRDHQDDRWGPSEAEHRYDDYRIEFKRRQAMTFFMEHKVRKLLGLY